jgi:hypothetical protein
MGRSANLAGETASRAPLDSQRRPEFNLSAKGYRGGVSPDNDTSAQLRAGGWLIGLGIMAANSCRRSASCGGPARLAGLSSLKLSTLGSRAAHGRRKRPTSGVQCTTPVGILLRNPGSPGFRRKISRNFLRGYDADQQRNRGYRQRRPCRARL